MRARGEGGNDERGWCSKTHDNKKQYYGSDYSPAPGARLLMSVISPGAPSARTRVSDIL